MRSIEPGAHVSATITGLGSVSMSLARAGDTPATSNTDQ
jgi:hypothetical protein